MKKLIIVFVSFWLTSALAFAFLYEVKPLPKEEIKKFTEEQLTQIYTDAVIERKASETFHGKAGFSPKEYASYKELLGFIVRLRQEMDAREMAAPEVDEYLR